MLIFYRGVRLPYGFERPTRVRTETAERLLPTLVPLLPLLVLHLSVRQTGCGATRWAVPWLREPSAGSTKCERLQSLDATHNMLAKHLMVKGSTWHESKNVKGWGVPIHAMQGAVKIQLWPFLTLAINGDEWPVLCLGHFTLQKRAPKMFCIVVPDIIFFSDQATQFSQYSTRQNVSRMLPILWIFRKVRSMKYVHRRAREIGFLTGRKSYFFITRLCTNKIALKFTLLKQHIKMIVLF